jgi:hypothetical protein
MGLVMSPAAGLGHIGGASAMGPVGFSPPVFVDTVRAGGEPGIWYSHKFGDLIYSSHEGTTHLDRSGATGAASTAGFLCPGALEPMVQQSCYSNHVWIWTSSDHGKTWVWREEGLQYSGFSDPDLTEDAAGNIYDTGINLVNDALFSSPDGGKSWPTGTTNCTGGDRPWLAGGKANEVFLSTDTNQAGHQLFYSNDAGASCSSTTIVDNGTYGGGTYSGFGKMVYDPVDGSVVEPAQFHNADGSFGVGISRLPSAAQAFASGSGAFQPQEVVDNTSVYSPFGVPEIMVMDSEENIYFSWDTDDREASTTTKGCGQLPNMAGGPTPKPSHIMFVSGKHLGPGRWRFSAPVSLDASGPARIPGARALWPWTVAGSPGNASVVWYQMDQLVDPDCDIAASNGQPAPGVKTYIYEAHITNAVDPARRAITVTNASGRFIHQGGICDSGTTCAATGQDRRLGDYFTNYVDANGCVVIASGDTTVPDAITGGDRITSLPIFIAQNSGPSLTGKDCGAAPAPVSGAPEAAATVTTPNTSRGYGSVWPLGLGLFLLALTLGLRSRRNATRR